MLKVKEIAEIVMSEFTPKIEEQGFQHYKGKQFVKVSDDILFYIELFPGKNDFYVWYAVYPLCSYKIWLGSAAIGGRLPEQESATRVNTKEDIHEALLDLNDNLKTIIDFFRARSTISDMETNISRNEKLGPLLVKGYCLAFLDKQKESEPFIQAYLDSGYRGRDDKEGAEILMAALENDTYMELLEKNKADNIKKLGLKKFISE